MDQFYFQTIAIAFQSLQRPLFYLESNFKNHVMNCQFVIFVLWFSPHTMVCQPTNNRGYLKMLNNCTFKKINKQATHKKESQQTSFLWEHQQQFCGVRVLRYHLFFFINELRWHHLLHPSPFQAKMNGLSDRLEAGGASATCKEEKGNSLILDCETL